MTGTVYVLQDRETGAYAKSNCIDKTRDLDKAAKVQGKTFCTPEGFSLALILSKSWTFLEVIIFEGREFVCSQGTAPKFLKS